SRVLDFRGVDPDALLVGPPRGVGEIVAIGVAPFTRLPADAAAYLAERPGRFRSTVTRGERRLAREGVTVRLVDGNDHDAVERALDALHRLHDGRWGDTSEFLDEWTSVAAALRRGAAAGAVRFGELVVAGSDAADPDAADSDAAGGEGSAGGERSATGETIAVEVDLVVGSRAAFYQAGRLTDHRWRASGSVLRMALVRSAIESGATEYDLLRGGEAYKADWARGSRPVMRIRRGVGPLGAAMVTALRLNAALQTRRAARSTKPADADGDRAGNSSGDAASGDGSARIVFYSEAAELGGAETAAKHLLGGLDQRFAVTIVGTTPGVVAELATARPASSTLVLPAIHDRSDVGAIVAHRRAIAALRPDIFHANLGDGSSCQYALLAALSVRGVAVVASEHSPMGVRSELSRRIKSRSSRRFDAHTAVGRAAARAVEMDVSLPEGSVTVIPNGVPPLDLDPPPRDIADPLVGVIARFDPVKGVDVAIEAVARLGGVHLDIAGDGRERPAIESLIDRLGVADRVRLLGYRADARHLLATFDVFVLASRLEGMSMSIIEAMLAGTPLVATDVGSIREVIEHEVTGLIVPPEDPEALAQAIRRLLDDPAWARDLADAARSVALDRFTAAANVASFELLYDRVLAARRKA
ncbi:MAG TPA: GNAT family N-acetyltransferase, partial [Microthrixaceae bacterium]|nr:GNAT family N-acetyltransferase [Microthrixaceae bacterium]